MKKNMLIIGFLVFALLLSAASNGTAVSEAAENASAGYAAGAAGGGNVIATAGPSCQNIGSKSEGWYFENELIRYDNCKGCYAVCDWSGSRSEGWYSSCDKSPIRYDKCSTQTTTTTLQPGKCMDTDGGLEYYTPGKTYVEGSGTVASDSCIVYSLAEGSVNVKPASTLIEHYCTEDGAVGSTKYECPYGCENGACIKSGECRADSDCEPYFSHCSCRWECGKRSSEPRMDCARMCPVYEETMTPVCGCIDNKCVQSKECVGEGEKGTIMGGERCCSGLEAVSNAMVVGGRCLAQLDSGFICISCGDGVCGAGENECNCQKDCGSPVKEKVTCVFTNMVTYVFTNTIQKQECYSEKGSCVAYTMKCLEGERCPSDYLTCTVNVEGNKGEVVTWKSSCGGYAKTTVDGVSEKALFKCGGEVKPCPMPICEGAYKTGEIDSNGCQVYKCPTSTTLQPPQTCEIPEDLQQKYETLVKKYKTLLENGGAQGEADNVMKEITAVKLMIEPYMEKCRTTTQEPTQTEPAVEEKDIRYYKERMVGILSSGEDTGSQITALKELRSEIDETIKRLLSGERINATEVQAVAEEIVVRPAEIQADAVKVKTDAVIVASMGGKEIEVTPTQTGVELNDGGIAAEVPEIRLSQEKMYVGSEELKVTPSQAASAVSGSVDGIRLVTDDKNKLVYTINAREEKKILGIVPIEVEKKVTVDGTTNQVITEEKPWWSVLAV